MAAASIAHDQLHVTVGVDTHKYLHTGHAKDQLGRDLGQPASSGQVIRHRLNRGGDRQASSALHRIVMARLRWHPPTKAYMAKRRLEGKSKHYSRHNSNPVTR
jgi:transposase